MKTCFS